MSDNYLNTFYKTLSEIPDYCYIKEFSPTVRNELGNTPLHAAASLNDIEAIKQLVKQGADINAKGEEGMTPLNFAILRNSHDAAKILIELGANQE